MAPPIGEMCRPEAPPTRPVPGFEMRFAQAVAGFDPGCSGNVVPGAPGSANATEAIANMSAVLTKIPTCVNRGASIGTSMMRSRSSSQFGSDGHVLRGTATRLSKRPTTPDSTTMPVSA
jgi:hypothetical protein